MSKPTAAARYAHHMARIDKALAELQRLRSATAPAVIDWGHVGTVEQIADRLEDVAAFASPTTEGGSYGYTTLRSGKRVKVWIPAKEES